MARSCTRDVSGSKERDLILQHLGSNPNKGWYAFRAQPPTRTASARGSGRRTRRSSGPSATSRSPRRPTARASSATRSRVEDGKLDVDLNAAARTTTTTTTTEPEDSGNVPPTTDRLRVRRRSVSMRDRAGVVVEELEQLLALDLVGAGAGELVDGDDADRRPCSGEPLVGPRLMAASSRVAPSISRTTAAGTSPLRSSGRPTTAASTTSGCSSSACSTSTAYTE